MELTNQINKTMEETNHVVEVDFTYSRAYPGGLDIRKVHQMD
jgi:hypothetical protein